MLGWTACSSSHFACARFVDMSMKRQVQESSTGMRATNVVMTDPTASGGWMTPRLWVRDPHLTIECV